ncbi:MAG: hypothetical protein WCL44_14760 [bacterium]
MKKLMTRSAVLLVPLVLVFCNSSARADGWLDACKAAYGFTNWVGQTKTNYVRLATNWVPDLAVLSMTNIRSASIETNAGVSVFSMFMCRATNDASVVIDVRTHSCLSVSNAHESLMSFFAVCSGLLVEGQNGDRHD